MRSVLVPGRALLAPGINLSTIRDGAILALAALLLLCCPSSLLAQDSCSTSINPAYCDNCYIDAEIMAIGCALGGNCTLSDVDAYLDNCLANTPPPYPPPPAAQACAGGPEGSCYITFLDPVPDLQDASGNLKTDAPSLATYGRKISAVAADSAARVVLRIAARVASDGVQVTLLDENGNAGQPFSAVGGLSSVGGSEKQSTLPLTAVDANGQAMAFAVYQPPADFVRSLIGSDPTAAKRFVSFQATLHDTQGNLPDLLETGSLDILRPPVVLVHGLWDKPHEWWSFEPFLQAANIGLTTSRAAYDKPVLVTASSPEIFNLDALWLSAGQPILAQSVDPIVSESSLGFDYNSYTVLAQIVESIDNFRDGKNKANELAAAGQADVIGHSMGGLVTRTLEQNVASMAGYVGVPPQGSLADAYALSFGQGVVHKLITIGTPHLGSPLAADLLADTNSCVRSVLAVVDNYALTSVTVNGWPVNGAVGDLQGDGVNPLSLSQALSYVQGGNQGGSPVPTAMLAGTINRGNLDGLTCTTVVTPLGTYQCLMEAARNYCFGDPLIADMAPSLWPQVFGGQASDGIVPLTSQLANLAVGGGNHLVQPTVDGLVHSAGAIKLGFNGPAEVESYTIQNNALTLLNEPVSGPDFYPLP